MKTKAQQLLNGGLCDFQSYEKTTNNCIIKSEFKVLDNRQIIISIRYQTKDNTITPYILYLYIKVIFKIQFFLDHLL